MGTIRVLSPQAGQAPGDSTLAPPAASLEGRILGIRRDKAWRSFEIFADELARRAPRDWGVARVVPFDPGERIGAPELESAKVVGFARAVDVAVVGLGT